MKYPDCDRCKHPETMHRGNTLLDWSTCKWRAPKPSPRKRKVVNLDVPLGDCPCDGYFEPRGAIV